MENKNLYANLFAKQWDNPMSLVQDIANDEEHIFWKCARDFARSVLARTHWHWVIPNIDDYGLIVEKNIQLKKWILWAKMGKGALLKRLTNTYDLISWLLIRYVNSIKNIFDSRYKNHIQPLIFITYDENKVYDYKEKIC